MPFSSYPDRPYEKRMAGKMAGGLLIALLCACETPQPKTAIAPPPSMKSTAGGAPVSSGIVLSGKTTAPRELVPSDLSKTAAAPAQRPALTATTPAATQLANGPDPALVHAALAEQPLIEGPTPAAPASGATDQAVPTSSSMPAAGAAVHLASYLDIAAAQRGWEILSVAHAELAVLKPLYVPVDVPGKGHFLRLYGTGANPAALGGICRRLQASGAYCALSTGR